MNQQNTKLATARSMASEFITSSKFRYQKWFSEYMDEIVSCIYEELTGWIWSGEEEIRQEYDLPSHLSSALYYFLLNVN